MDGDAEDPVIMERQAAIEAVSLPMLHIGADLRLGAANTPARAILAAHSLGRHYGLSLRQPSLVAAIETVAQGGEKQQLRCSLTPSAHETVYDVIVAPAPGGGAYCSFFDVTEQELIGQLRRDFVANVSHELRTPLTALLGFIETLQGPAKNDAAARERFLGIMAREAERMTRLVRDLLSLSRVEAQERQRPERKVDLVALMSSVLTTLQSYADDAGVELKIDKGTGDLAVLADTDQLTQVFHNLVENAVKYGTPGKLVTVTVRRLEGEPGFPGGAVSIAVRDHGEGIEAKHLPRLTERFYRVDTHRSREMGGTGLGLAIVKHIVNRHRGRLRIESVQGEGSTFTVLLPAG